MMVEAVAAEIVEEDRSAAPDAYKRHWFGSESELEAMLAQLGFSALDQEGILASLRSHRDAARKLEVDQVQVEKAGFVELAQG